MKKKITTSITLNNLERENLEKLAKLYNTNMSDILRYGMWIMFERYLPKEEVKRGFNSGM